MANVQQIILSDINPGTVGSLMRVVQNSNMSIYKLALMDIKRDIRSLCSDPSWIKHIISDINEEIEGGTIIDTDTIIVYHSFNLDCNIMHDSVCDITATFTINSIKDTLPYLFIRSVNRAIDDARCNFYTDIYADYSECDYVGQVFYNLSALRLADISINDLSENDDIMPEEITLHFSLALK